MIDARVQKKLNSLISEIDIIKQRNNFLWHSSYGSDNQHYKDIKEICENNDKIKALKAKISKLYITYSQ